MLGRICKWCGWLAVAIWAVCAQGAVAAENEVEIGDVQQIQETAFLVSAEDLYLVESDILVKVGERAYPVRSLERSGDQWVATILVDANYCPLGHLTCKNCGLCHKEKCRYYVKPCKLWE